MPGASDRFPTRRLDSSEQIAGELRRYIERQQLRPGDRLGTEQTLAAEFGASRPTLREAVRLLAGSHLLRVERGRSGGIFVAGTPAEGLGRSLSASVATLVAAGTAPLAQLLEVRGLIEGAVAGLAAERADDATLLELASALEQVEGSEPGSAEFAAGSLRFHRLLAQATGNELLVAFTRWILDVLLPLMERRLVPSLERGTLAREYRAILQAVQLHRPEAARQAMAAHLEHMARLLEAHE